MRTLTACPEFYYDDTPLIPWEAKHYIKIPGCVSGRLVSETGYKALDIWACMIARASSWQGTLSGSYAHAGDGTSGTFSGAVDIPIGLYTGTHYEFDTYPTVADYSDHPEVTTLAYEFLEVGWGQQSGIGMWHSPTTDSPWNVDIWMDVRPKAEFGVGWGGPRIIGNDLYIPLHVQVFTTNVADGIGFTWDTAQADDDALELGAVTISIPDWIDGGTNSLSLPIYNFGSSFSGTASFNLTLVPTSHFSYGEGELNVNEIWNSDGSANLNPLENG